MDNKTGDGVPQDKKEAVKCWRKAAERGYADAQFKLGLAYDHREGVPQDYKEAIKWDRKAAEQGNALAQYDLGFAYFNGAGVPEDHILAYAWWNIAALTERNRLEKTKKSWLN